MTLHRQFCRFGLAARLWGSILCYLSSMLIWMAEKGALIESVLRMES